MATELLIAIGGLVAMLASGVMWFFRSRRRKKIERKTAEAMDLHAKLENSRASLIHGGDTAAAEVARLEKQLADKKAELIEIRAHKDKKAKEWLDELDL